MKVYLAGPINGTTDEEANGWRTQAKLLLPDVLDPMARDYRGKEDEAVKDIVEGDKRDIDSADAVIAYCPKPSVGTSMEVLYCYYDRYGRRKPCIVIVPDGSPCSPWLRYHATDVVSTIEDAVQALLALNPERMCKRRHEVEDPR